MSVFQVDFDVSNPSPYDRSGYVQVDLDKLQVPRELDDSSLALYRLEDVEVEIAYQIDFPFGRDVGRRVLTFLSDTTPAGPENYHNRAVSYRIKQKRPTRFPTPANLRVGHYYHDPAANEPQDGFNWEWGEGRPVKDVKLVNDMIEVNFHLSPSPTQAGLSYGGSATSIYLPRMDGAIGTGDILSPFDWDFPEKLWGQLTELVFYPLPWEHKQFYRFDIRGQNYQLVWSKSGPVRAIIALKSEPFVISYDGRPYFEGTKAVSAHLYRVIYLNNILADDSTDHDQENPHYIEELYVLTESGREFLNFRPYYLSVMPFGQAYATNVVRLEHIPDYFAIWKHFGKDYFGCGFAADAHVRWVQTRNNEVSWRLPLSQNCRCVHYFMYVMVDPTTSDDPTAPFDPCHTIGHKGWYEKVFKPIRTVNQLYDFPSPLER